MKLSKLKLYNYRCFGSEEQIIAIDKLTTFIGNNSAGKTAALSALNTLFSENINDRTLYRSDFHLPKDKEPNELEKQELYIIEIKAHNEEAENSVGTFHLEEVYQSHVDYIYEILWKHVAYNKDRLTSLLDNFKGLFDKNEAKEMIFGQYLSDDKLYKRPLAKLTRDILDDLNQTR